MRRREGRKPGGRLPGGEKLSPIGKKKGKMVLLFWKNCDKINRSEKWMVLCPAAKDRGADRVMNVYIRKEKTVWIS